MAAVAAHHNDEGIISVRQVGWNTGWRREESRILGVFRAVPSIEKARRVDGYWQADYNRFPFAATNFILNPSPHNFMSSLVSLPL